MLCDLPSSVWEHWEEDVQGGVDKKNRVSDAHNVAMVGSKPAE